MKTLGHFLTLLISSSLLMSSVLLAEDSAEENFGRLFTTPSERQNLDLAREQGRLFKKPSETVDMASTDGQSLKKPAPVKMSGIILRADGKAQVWVSGQPLYSTLKQLNTDKNNSSHLRIPLSGKSISLKPGQVLANGKAKESYYFVTQSSSASSQVAVEPLVQSSSSVSSVSSSSVSSQAGGNAQVKTP
jgi:hypothetical protein